MFRRISQIIQLPRRALSLLLHGAEQLREIAVATRRISKTGVAAANVTSDVARRTAEIQHDMKRVSKDVRSISDRKSVV